MTKESQDEKADQLTAEQARMVIKAIEEVEREEAEEQLRDEKDGS